MVIGKVVKTVVKAPKSTRGSGPRVHNVGLSGKKKAHDADNNSGQGEPIHDSNAPCGGGHYHPADKAGNKITDGQQSGVHHNYHKGKWSSIVAGPSRGEVECSKVLNSESQPSVLCLAPRFILQ